ncbi:MAG: biopolymer transporter ExbD [Bacteroidales bacterium]|nr:biopolymer transporter ExbD [Bacteroidales bacterium]
MAIEARNKIGTSFNMSSMTDIVFLLLIFFMVTSTQIAPNGLQVTLPQSSSQVKLIPHVSVSIDANGRFAVNTTVVPFEEVENRLKQELAGQDEPAIVLRVDKDVPTGETVRIMEIANRNRWKFTLATKP